MRSMFLAIILLAPMPVLAQAPAAGSSGGGGVGASVATPTAPQGKTPPGTPDGASAPDRAKRDVSGQAVIGHTSDSKGGLPGNTGAPDSGVTR